MTTLRKVLPLVLLALVALWTFTPSHHSPIQSRIAFAQSSNPPDCSFTFTFTTDATQATQSNLSSQNPCTNWKMTLSATGSLSTTATFQTSPDGSTWTAVTNTACTSVQPPCILQGANPIIGTQGMAYMSAYGSYVRVVTSSSSGTGTGTIRVYGAKGASAASIPQGGAGGGSGTVTSVGFTGGLISVGTPTTTPALTVAGTSGGIPYFSSASTWASTAALTQYGVIVGGGTGSAPTAIAADTVTTHALFATLGAPAFRALAAGDYPTMVGDSGAGGVKGAVPAPAAGDAAAGKFLQANGTWTVPTGGSGTVTTVGWTGGIVTVATPTTTPAFTIAGTSGGIPYFSSASTWASSGVLTANRVVLGGGAGATPTVTAADSTTTHALFATAGAPAFRALASSDIPALAYVTSVGWTGGIVTVATGTTTPAFTIAGTSGGIPYFSSASTWASSGALTANGVVLGGGAGATPTVTAADSTTTHALFATAGAPAFRALALTDLPSGTGQGTGTLNVIPKWSNTTGGLADSDVTDDGTTITVKRNTTFANPTPSTGTMVLTLTPGAAQTIASTTLANGGSETIAGKLNIAGTSLNSALLSVGNVSATNYNGSYYIFGTNTSQSSVGYSRVGILAETNDATNPTSLEVNVYGATLAADRGFELQTGTEGVANLGNLYFQGYGGSVCIGQHAPCTSLLTVNGTASMTTAIITGSSFTFNGKTCTIISTVVTCT